MKIACVWEHNGDDSLLFARDYPGAYSRGSSCSEAAFKMLPEIRKYHRWKGLFCPEDLELAVIQDVPSELNIADADSDVLLEGEEQPLSMDEYLTLKKLVLRSAADFLELYQAIPDKQRIVSPVRKTFYGDVPNTAEAMYLHTKSVNAYYFGEINVDAGNEGTILECRIHGFETLESMPDFLSLPVVEGSYGERGSVRKVLRRFLWHDRIHAKAMYRRSVASFGPECIPDVFCFDEN